MITAHNGADRTRENSMAFVRHALSSSADALEIDIRRHPDGTLVFTHDINDAPSSSLDPVRSVFEALRGTGKLVNCDLKEGGLEDDVFSLARACGVEDRLIYTGTVSAAHCKETGLNRIVRIALNIEEYIPGLYARCLDASMPAYSMAQTAVCAEEMCRICLQYDIPRINAHYRLATLPFQEVLRQNGVDLSVWTVNDPAELKRFVQAGVYNVTTRNLP